VLSVPGSPLVSGSTAVHMSNKHIEVLRPFYVGGVLKRVGEVIEVESRFGSEMVHANKARVVDAPKPVEKPATAETKPPAPAKQETGKRGEK
jgi:hypothetical protein